MALTLFKTSTQGGWKASFEGVVVFSKGEANWDSADTINLGEKQKLS